MFRFAWNSHVVLEPSKAIDHIIDNESETGQKLLSSGKQTTKSWLEFFNCIIPGPSISSLLRCAQKSRLVGLKLGLAWTGSFTRRAALAGVLLSTLHKQSYETLMSLGSEVRGTAVAAVDAGQNGERLQTPKAGMEAVVEQREKLFPNSKENTLYFYISYR